MQIVDCGVGYTVTTFQGHTVEALSPEEMAQDFPDLYWECELAITHLFSAQPSDREVRAHWVLPIVSSESNTGAGVVMTCCATKYGTVRESIEHTCSIVAAM